MLLFIEECWSTILCWCSPDRSQGPYIIRFSQDPTDDGEDQAMYQYKLWAPVDGTLHPNVVLQIKNGPL